MFSDQRKSCLVWYVGEWEPAEESWDVGRRFL